MIKPKLLLATNNKGKLDELRELFSGIPFELVGPLQMGLRLDVEETGSSYAANARLKARAFASASGLLTLADDSGLEVDALDGAPGVLSSRYAGPGASDGRRVAYLLDRMPDVPWEKRSAHFRCAMAIATPSGEIKTSSGTCNGIIMLFPQGDNGFGYDPIFYIPEFKKTVAELLPEIKNRISHRARAAVGAKKILLGMVSLPLR